MPSVEINSTMAALDSTATNNIAASWLENFSKFSELGDVDGIVSCFLPDGWLRDVLIFNWSNRTFIGQQKIKDHLAANFAAAKISDLALDKRQYFTPELAHVTPTQTAVASGFTFSTVTGIARGYFHLLPDAQGVWKALAVFMILDEIHGHPEEGPELGIYGDHTLSWDEVHRKRRESVEKDPYVLIIGAGQTGLILAARFQQMNMPTLVVESHARVGDNWRVRYPTLTLHSPRSQFQLLYQPYPKNWPIYASRDKVASWLEQYASSQDLSIWTNSRTSGTPTYDPETKKWTVVIDHAGTPTTVHPTHVVTAFGILGAPLVPHVDDREVFEGRTLHAADYPGGKPFVGKRVIVVGAGNSGADICQDLVTQGAQSVTIVQRSSTCVVAKHPNYTNNLLKVWPDGVPVEVCDFKFQALPLLLRKRIAASQADAIAAAEKDLHDGLRKAGLHINMGDDGSGQFPMVFEKSGGFWIDVGCAGLITSGEVKVKHGVEVKRYLNKGVVFTDGSMLDADVVIYATGYHNVKETIKSIFGEEVVKPTGEIWGLDEEGELKGCYKPSGYPGLWFAGGELGNSRFLSKRMALEMKAIQLGLKQ